MRTHARSFRSLHRSIVFLTLACAGSAVVACSSADDDSDVSEGAFSTATACRGDDWNEVRECREREIQDYVKSPAQAANFSWFKESPLGFGGVPYVLLRDLMNTYPDVWPADNLGFAPHPDDYARR